MVNINLYQPGGINANIEFPSNWNELDTADLEILSKHLLATYDNGIQQKALIFADILKSKIKKNKIDPSAMQLLDSEDVAINGMPLIEFLFAENLRTKQPYATLHIPGELKKFTGPDDDFNNIVCGEYEDADIHFLKFKEKPDGIHLAKLASVLYRPAKMLYVTFNSRTNSYVNYESDKIEKKFLKLPPYVLYSIFIWYGGCRNKLTKIFKNVYEKGAETTDQIDLMAFTKCIHAAAGPKNGTRENVRKTLLKEILYEMEIELIKSKEVNQQ